MLTIHYMFFFYCSGPLRDLHSFPTRRSSDLGAEGHRERRVDQDERPRAVLQSEHRDQARKRDEEERGRHQVRQKDPDAQPLAPRSREPRQAVAPGHRQHERNPDDDQTDEQRVEEPGRVERLAEERGQVLEGRRAVEEERVVGGIGGTHVEVGVLLERGHHHPVEGKHREHDEEEDEHAVAQRRRQSSSPTRRHHATSARRDTRSIVTARITSTGSRKMATEAPRPTSPPSTPSWKARLASTWVEL